MEEIEIEEDSKARRPLPRGICAALASLLAALALLGTPQNAWALWHDVGWGLPGAYDTSWYAGPGDYTLTSASQLAGLARLVNAEGVTFNGSRITLGNDIDLSGREWAPIGFPQTTGCCFSGTFDGAGRTISGLTITGSGIYKALFGNVQNGVVKNLIVRGSVSGSYCVAGIVANCSGSSFKNLANYATVSSSGAITQDGTFNGSAAGVICYASTAYDSGTQYFENLYNYGTISAAGQNSGGVIGFIMSSAGKVNISQCANYGNLSVSATQNVNDATDSVGGVVGGTAGYGSYSISECVNTGNVSTANMYSTGGIVGQLGGSNSFVSYSYNKGSINGAHTAGGIVGTMNAVGGQVAECYSSGTVNAVSSVGGIVGAASSDPSSFARNNFYLAGTASGAFGGSDDTDGLGLGLSKNELGSSSTLSVLNALRDAYAAGKDGLPVLGWQREAIAGGGVKPVAPAPDPGGDLPQQGSSVVEQVTGDQGAGDGVGESGVPAVGDVGAEGAGQDAAGAQGQEGAADTAAVAQEEISPELEPAAEEVDGAEQTVVELKALPEESPESELPPVDEDLAAGAVGLALFVVLVMGYGVVREYGRFFSQRGRKPAVASEEASLSTQLAG